MSDYVVQATWSTKDALATGQALKAISATELGTEFDAIATAVATKYDSDDRGAASGLAPLDGSSLVPVANLPAATDSAIGAVELATTAEVVTGTDTTRAVTAAGVEAVLTQNAAILEDISHMTDPNADRIIFWDDSDGAAEFLSVSSPLSINVNALEWALLGLENLTDPNDDRIIFWDDSAGNTTWLNPTNGIEISTTSLQLTDVSASASLPIALSSGTWSWDSSSITELTIESLSHSQDGFLVDDNGALKVMPYDRMGIDVQTGADTNHSFADGDQNSVQRHDSTTARTWTIDPDATFDFQIGTVIIVSCVNTGTITITAGTGVTLYSRFNSAGATATSDVIRAGGSAALIKTAGNEWTITGDIDDS
ncbi:MAG: hypothetical protein GTN93_18180 [Anaerolineae bacterium]|nr:hypothetical protein [Anaerolineae bacterium]NIQ79975.1 hypothetical protein [Anaerolineae bacterium]